MINSNPPRLTTRRVCSTYFNKLIKNESKWVKHASGKRCRSRWSMRVAYSFYFFSATRKWKLCTQQIACNLYEYFQYLVAHSSIMLCKCTIVSDWDGWSGKWSYLVVWMCGFCLLSKNNGGEPGLRSHMPTAKSKLKIVIMQICQQFGQLNLKAQFLIQYDLTNVTNICSVYLRSELTAVMRPLFEGDFNAKLQLHNETFIVAVSFALLCTKWTKFGNLKKKNY